MIASRRRPMKARNVSTCKHWLSGLLKCSVCGATLSYTGNNKCPYFQGWKYAKGFHKTSVALSVKKAEEAVTAYFDQILSGTDFTYVRKDHQTSIPYNTKNRHFSDDTIFPADGYLPGVLFRSQSDLSRSSLQLFHPLPVLLFWTSDKL